MQINGETKDGCFSKKDVKLCIRYFYFRCKSVAGCLLPVAGCRLWITGNRIGRSQPATVSIVIVMLANLPPHVHS